MLPIASSTYREQAAKHPDPTKLSARALPGMAPTPEITRVFAGNSVVYGACKVWQQMLREDYGVPRCTVERLMAEIGLPGVFRGKPARAIVRAKAAACLLNQVNRQFHVPAPRRLWLSDFTCVSTWSGLVYVAFIIDAYAQRIVGWRITRTAHSGLVLDASEQALRARPSPRQQGQPRASLRSWPAICQHPSHRAAGIGGYRTLGRQHRRQL